MDIDHEDDDLFEEPERTPRNREKVQAGRHEKGPFWCYGCDAALVYHGEKCPVCGRKEKGPPKRLKKFRAED